MSVGMLNDEFTEITHPVEMIPIITKDNDVLWYKSKLISNNGITNVDNNLYTMFSNIYDKLKLYIDTFNFTYFIYKDTLRLHNDQSEQYDSQFNLNNDLKEKIELYKQELKKYLAIIHEQLNKMNEVLEIKHKIN